MGLPNILAGRYARWFPLLVILALAIWLRLPLLAGTGYSTSDITVFEDWARSATRQGLFAVYTNVKTAPVDHPPIGVTLLTISARVYELMGGSLDSDNAGFRTAIKFPLFIFDLLLVIVVYAIAQRELTSAPLQLERGDLGSTTSKGKSESVQSVESKSAFSPLQRASLIQPDASAPGVGLAALLWPSFAAAVIAFTPGLIADSVWWGQTDGLFAFFLLITVYALHRRANSAAWLLYALTILVKFQGITLLPLIVVLSLRRFGIGSVLRGAAIFALVVAVGLAPFVLASGEAALRPYRESVGKYPFISINAHNFWFWSLSSQFNLRDFGQPTDTAYYIGPYPVRIVGYALFALAAGLIALRALILPQRRDEFLLAAGLHVSFFMFSTQMHERYLYPAVPLMAVAMVGSAWLWLPCMGFAITVSHNILDVGSRDYPLWEATWRVVGWSGFQNARFNVILSALLAGAILHPLYGLTHLPALTARGRRVLIGILIAALVLGEIGLRANYAQLPAWMQRTLSQTRLTPFTDWRLSTTALAEPDPDYGAIVRPGLSNERFSLSGQTFTVSTASLPGSRVGIRDTTLRLPLDVMALGGADTFCMAEAKDCWINQVASERSLSIANLGQPETGSTARLMLLRQVGPQLKARIVLWQWSVADLQADYKLALRQGRTGNLEPPSQATQAACHPTLGQYSAIYALICALDRWPPPDPTAHVEYGSVSLVMASDIDALAADRPDMRYGYNLTIQALDEANRFVQDELHATMIVLLLPTPQEVYSNRASPPFNPAALDQLSQSRLRLLQTCQERGWKCIDLYPPLRMQAERAQQVYYAAAPYLNAAGNRVIAQAVAPVLAP